MIRRISKHNDLKDLIKSCPSGVIDDIYAIEYYIQGYNTVIQANFTKTGEVLEVILPSVDLETLPNGILMRRAFYKVLDASYPDGYYNLQFEDNMSVWLGEVESEEPVIPEYVTEEELAETLGDYATQDWVEDQGYLTEHQDLTGYATDDDLTAAVGAINAHFTAVEGELYSVSQTANQAQDAADAAGGAADQALANAAQALNGVQQAQGAADAAYQAAQQAQDAARQANYTAAAARQDAQSAQAGADAALQVAQSAQDGVQQLSSDLSDMDIIVGDLSDSVSGLDSRVTDIENADFQGQIDGLDQRVYDLEQGGVGGGSWGSITGNIQDQQDLMDEFDNDRGRLDDLENGTVVPTGTATESWVGQQGYLTASALSGYATESWVLNSYTEEVVVEACGKAEGNVMEWVQEQSYLTASALSGYATESWVQSQGYLTSHQDLSSYATKSWVSSQQFATESWVSSQGYLTSHQDLTGYATESWVQSQGYLTSHQDLSSYATQSWVSSQQFATQSWVSSQGYLTSHQDLSSYATQSWATSTFFEESKIWVGTLTQWNALTSAQKSAYTIAMIRE